MIQDLHTAFQDITRSLQPDQLIRFLDVAEQIESVQAGKRTLMRLA